MKIIIVTPQPPGSTLGNAITANRWVKLLRELGHEVMLAMHWVPGNEKCDVLIALHARRSHPSIQQFRQADAVRPLIVALTGTDLYGDLPAGDPEALRSLELATRIVVLQESACVAELTAIDDLWSDHLAAVAELRSGVHWFAWGGRDPLHEYLTRIHDLYQDLEARLEGEIALRLEAGAVPLQRGATWTYLTTDNPFGNYTERIIKHFVDKFRKR